LAGAGSDVGGLLLIPQGVEAHHMVAISIGKLLAVIFAGLFGILGLTTEFKNPKTGRLTKWGLLSLFGIVVSTLTAVLTQTQETALQNRERVEQQKKYQDDLEQNIRISKSTNEAVVALNRLMHPITGLKTNLHLRASCKDPLFRQICKHAEQIVQRDFVTGEDEYPEGGANSVNHPSILKDWPNVDKEPNIPLDVAIFCGQNAIKGRRWDLDKADLDFDFDIEIKKLQYPNMIAINKRDVDILFVGLTPDGFRTTDRIESTEDFAGCTLVLDAFYIFPRMDLVEFSFDDQNGRRITLNRARIVRNRFNYFEYKFESVPH
jgi:hypothetical protein